jgi:8-amino-3,8-dideoxy-alpha-D-manno-octulosonate transaminase
MYQCDQEELQAIQKVLESRKLFRYQGPDVPTECFLFEAEFAKYIGTSHSVLLSSGTNALVCALFTLGVGPGDEVLVPSYTFFATMAAVMEVGAIPVVINIDEHFNIDLSEAEKYLSPKTKAIIPVHMDGAPCDMEKIIAWASAKKILVIEDVAQAVGGSFKNKKLGSWGDAGCFSFNMDKIITCGEGGAVTFKNPDHYQKAMMYHDTCNQFGPTLKAKYLIPGFVGKSMRASEIQGAMIRIQLRKLNSILDALKISREKLLQNILTSYPQLELIPAIDLSGDCNTTLRFLAPDPIIAGKLVLELNKNKITSYCPMMRPAHHPWQWHHLLPKHPANVKMNFLTTIEKISRTINVQVQL